MSPFNLHEPVQVELAVWNRDVTPLAWIGDQAMEADTYLEVVYPDGRAENLGPPKWARGADVMAGVSRVTIAPGQAYRQSILLHDWLPFDREGKYTIRLSVRGAESPVTFYVEIGPRDEAALKARCEKLIATASLSRHPESTLSARALANIQDPIAIPYLERLAGIRALTSGHATAALFEMGTPAAIRRPRMSAKNSRTYKQALPARKCGRRRPRS